MPGKHKLKKRKNYSTWILTSADIFCGILMDNNALMCSLHHTATEQKTANAWTLFWSLNTEIDTWHDARRKKIGLWNKFENDKPERCRSWQWYQILGGWTASRNCFQYTACREDYMHDKVKQNMINGFNFDGPLCGQQQTSSQ